MRTSFSLSQKLQVAKISAILWGAGHEGLAVAYGRTAQAIRLSSTDLGLAENSFHYLFLGRLHIGHVF